jgi:hypothetical protein
MDGSPSEVTLLAAVGERDLEAMRALYDRHAGWPAVRLTRWCNVCDSWARRPEIAGEVVYRVPRCLAACQPVSPVRPRRTAPAPHLVTFPVTQKALSRLGKGLDLRKLVAGGGFEPPTSGL